MDILNSSLLQDGLAGKLDGINSSDIGDKVIDLSVPIPIGTTIHATEPTAPVETVPTKTTVIVQQSGLTAEQKKHLTGAAVGAAIGAIVAYATKGRYALLIIGGAVLGAASTYTHSQLTANKI